MCRTLLGFLHTVVERVILCLHFCQPIGGELVLDGGRWCGHLLTRHQSKGKLLLCHYYMREGPHKYNDVMYFVLSQQCPSPTSVLSSQVKCLQL